MKILTGHTTQENAYEVKNYPYGFRLRTSIFYWIETEPKKGDRFCSYTIDPRNGRKNKPKKSTYYGIMLLTLNEENGHMGWAGFHQLTEPAKAVAFMEKVGIEKLLPEQLKMYNSILGIHEVKTDEFTGEKKKDFSVKWERQTVGAGWKDGVYNRGEKGKYIEVKITFDRPDGVSLREIYAAMKSLNQAKLNEVFEVRDYGRMGEHAGVVRVCCRGGSYLGEMSEGAYREYLASDDNQIREEAA